jgi:hypothetical protein
MERAHSFGMPAHVSRQGYLLHAPLDRDGYLDVDEFEAARDRAVVEELRGSDIDPRRGRLLHRGRTLWSFSFGAGDEELIFHLSDSCIVPGEQLTVRGRSGKELTFRITVVTRVGTAAQANVAA